MKKPLLIFYFPESVTQAGEKFELNIGEHKVV